MLKFPMDIPANMVEHHKIVDTLVHILKKEEMQALSLRLNKLRSDAILYRILHPISPSKSDAMDCVICNGKGTAHFCINPYCNATSKSDQDTCSHFTPLELKQYMEIHRDYVSLLREVAELIDEETSPLDIIPLIMGNMNSKDCGSN